MTDLIFSELKLTDKYLFKRFTNDYINSESSFANILMWKKQYNAHFSIINDCLVLKYTNPKGIVSFSMPYTNNGDILAATRVIIKYCKSNNLQYLVLDGNENYINILKNCKDINIEYEQNRDFQEYVYLSDKLANLSGKELHSKKNHVNKFKSTYNYKYVQIDKSLIPLCENKTLEWLNKKYKGDTMAFAMEFSSVKCALDNFEYFDLFGGAIFVDDNLAAYTIGEKIATDTALVHIEKADISYNGAFAIINYEFSNFLNKSFKYINREEDMGIEGLRKAKMSYRPEFLTDKYKCLITEV